MGGIRSCGRRNASSAVKGFVVFQKVVLLRVLVFSVVEARLVSLEARVFAQTCVDTSL